MITLVENGEVYSPEPLGRRDVLVVNDRIVMLGEVDRRGVKALGQDLKVIDASGCVVTPGFIDPHEHLLGGSGEEGFSTQTPEINLGEIVTAGITTVVGALGVDTTMKTMAGLLAKVKALREEGMTAYLWTGGYNVPPTSITDSVRNDIMYIAEVIGAGEIAISDERSTDPGPRELARLVKDAYVGGMLSNKAGVTHFHVGDKEERLTPLKTLLEDFGVEPGLLYPTHVERGEALMREAVDMSKRGMFVDIDTVEEDLPKWLRFYLDNGGDPKRLTVSSDASITSPHNLFGQVRECIIEHGFAIEQVLPLATQNTAEVLKLDSKGRLEVGKDADVLVLTRKEFGIKDVIVRGKQMVEGGRFITGERFLEQSNRRISLQGKRPG
ncbi:MAG TPA: amidohydrolase family protein [Blastocatellia bacterium]|jgi:beta-aspartyl-dipeptidase (metallo-type)|nr:amidohydrolase family protein [Blastocatellia bacterium]